MMKQKRMAFCALVLCLWLALLSGCDTLTLPEVDGSVESSETNAVEESKLPDTASQEMSASERISEQLQQMSIREKVGQLFIVRPDSLDFSQTSEQINDASANGVTELTASMKEAMRNYPVGGIALFAKNIAAPTQLEGFIRSLQSASATALFMAIDEEGGLVARLANHQAFDLPKYKSAAAVAESGRSEDALSMGQTIGGYLKQYGFNLDFAPVADVNTNPDNPVIGTRAFSTTGETAAIMAAAMADGLKGRKIIPTFKHFPGHGDTAEDSHSGLAVNYKTRAEMETCEWLPYQSLTNLDCVMMGHIAVPNITGDLTPASMSYEMVTKILRESLGFDGVVVTDSLSMQAITDNYDEGEAAVNAVLAGCDILLMPWSLEAAFDAVVAAVEDGRISEQRLDESLCRILTLKNQYEITYVAE